MSYRFAKQQSHFFDVFPPQQEPGQTVMAPNQLGDTVQATVDALGTGKYLDALHERQGPAAVAVQVGSTVPVDEIWLILFASAHWTGAGSRSLQILIENTRVTQETAIGRNTETVGGRTTRQAIIQAPFFLPPLYRVVARLNSSDTGLQLDFDRIELSLGEYQVK